MCSTNKFKDHTLNMCLMSFHVFLSLIFSYFIRVGTQPWNNNESLMTVGTNWMIKPCINISNHASTKTMAVRLIESWLLVPPLSNMWIAASSSCARMRALRRTARPWRVLRSGAIARTRGSTVRSTKLPPCRRGRALSWVMSPLPTSAMMSRVFLRKQKELL